MYMSTPNTSHRLCAEVDLMNDDAERVTVTASGETVAHAIDNAIALQSLTSGDDSWTMTDWRAA